MFKFINKLMTSDVDEDENQQEAEKKGVEVKKKVELSSEQLSRLHRKSAKIESLGTELFKEHIRHKKRVENIDQRYESLEEEAQKELDEIKEECGVPVDLAYEFSPPEDGDPKGQLILIEDADESAGTKIQN